MAKRNKTNDKRIDPVSNQEEIVVDTPIGKIVVRPNDTLGSCPGVLISLRGMSDDATIEDVVACFEYDAVMGCFRNMTYGNPGNDAPSNIQNVYPVLGDKKPNHNVSSGFYDAFVEVMLDWKGDRQRGMLIKDVSGITDKLFAMDADQIMEVIKRLEKNPIEWFNAPIRKRFECILSMRRVNDSLGRVYEYYHSLCTVYHIVQARTEKGVTEPFVLVETASNIKEISLYTDIKKAVLDAIRQLEDDPVMVDVSTKILSDWRIYENYESKFMVREDLSDLEEIYD